MKFREIFVQLLLTAITGISAYGTSKLSNLTDSVNTLNVNFATMMERVSNQGKRLDDHDSEIKVLRERKR